jgi:acetolactate synthase-1/2/3 large subunit
MTGADILIACLQAQGVDTLTGMPGNQNIHIYDAVLRADNLRHILIRHEQGATLIANGYARASGRVGVALTVPGPGATNASTGLVDAHTDCVPVLLVTGGTEVAFDGRDRSKCFHGLDQETFFKPITRFFARPKSIGEIPAAVIGAFKALRAPRPGPVVIELPTDIAAAEGTAEIPPYIKGDCPEPNTAEIERVAQALQTSQRPVILAGSAITHANATDALLTLAESLDIPVIYTRLGKGVIPDGHPLTIGHCSAQFGKTITAEADLLLAIGCRFTQIDTRSWQMPLPDRIVQLDPEVSELGREYPIEAGASGDLAQSIPQLQDAVGSYKAVWGEFINQTRTKIQSNRRPMPIMAPTRKSLPDDAIIVVDVTSIGYRAFDEYPITVPRTFLYPSHSVTLGFAVPAAIGAKLACPDQHVVAFCGDGGFQMTASELATAAEHGIATVSVVSNDGSLSAIRGSQVKAFDGRVIDTDMQTPRLADLARSLGARGVRVDDPERFEAVFADTLGLEGPTVIEVMLQEQRDFLISQVPWLYPDE